MDIEFRRPHVPLIRYIRLFHAIVNEPIEDVQVLQKVEVEGVEN